MPAAANVASTAPKIRAPTEAPAAASGPAAALALARKSATVIPCPSANIWTLPGLGASISSQQEA